MSVQVYTFAWRNGPQGLPNARRAALCGRRCVIEVAGGSMRTVLIRFLDSGERVTTSRRALRRVPPPASSAASRRVPQGGGRS